MTLVERYTEAKKAYNEADTAILEMLINDVDGIEVENKEKELGLHDKYKIFDALEDEVEAEIFEAMRVLDTKLYNEFMEIKKDNVMQVLARQKLIEVGINLLAG